MRPSVFTAQFTSPNHRFASFCTDFLSELFYLLNFVWILYLYFQNISRHLVLRFVFDYIRTWKIRRRWGLTLFHDDQSTSEIRGPFRPKLDTATISDHTKLPSSLFCLMPGIAILCGSFRINTVTVPSMQRRLWGTSAQMPAYTVTPGTLSSSSNIRRGF